MNETYPDDLADVIREESAGNEVHRISMKDIPGRDMYCSDEAESRIREHLEQLPGAAYGIHFIDSGNYHYLSRIFTSFIKEKYDLVLIDHHTDMQETAFGKILSCGSWASEVLGKDVNLRSLTLCGPESAEGGRRFDMEAFGKKVPCMMFGEESADPGIPLYFSVDKDVLCEDECVTNWDQGDLTLSELGDLIKKFSAGRKVIGADICGGVSVSDPAWSDEALEKNTASDIYLYRLISGLMEADERN